MSEVQEICRLLDERGIKYEQSHIEGIAEYAHVTKWKTQAGNKCTFYEIEDGQPPYFTRMFIELPTPEQAVEATLGPEPCHITYCEDDYGMDGWLCDGCGEWFAATLNHTPTNNIRHPHFCPNCGRKVES